MDFVEDNQSVAPIGWPKEEKFNILGRSVAWISMESEE